MSPGGKSDRYVGLTSLTPSCPDGPGMWEPQPPGNLRDPPGFVLLLHLQCEDNLLSLYLCASHFLTLISQYSSEAYDITTLPSTNNKSNLLWSSKILNMYVCSGIHGKIFAIITETGVCVEGFYWTTTVQHYTGTIVKWQAIHMFLLKSLCMSVVCVEQYWK